MRAQEAGREVELVAIGCSAGGFDALRTILPALPADFDKPVVVVIHLLPGRESLVAQSFESRCRLKVKEAEDKEPLRPGTIYIAPPDYHLLLEPEGSFSLSVEDLVNCSRPSIDVTFETAAHVYGSRMVGVLLTGANSDGAEGLRLIREKGGIAIVEDPATAQYRPMPEAGARMARPQLVMDLAGIAEWLSGLGKRQGGAA